MYAVSVKKRARGKTGDVLAHVARPKGDEKLPGVIVIHENRGLNPHTEEVARRVALEEFLAIAPNIRVNATPT